MATRIRNYHSLGLKAEREISMRVNGDEGAPSGVVVFVDFSRGLVRTVAVDDLVLDQRDSEFVMRELMSSEPPPPSLVDLLRTRRD